jgi:hypothetical protein
MVTPKTRREKRKHAIVVHVRSNRGVIWDNEWKPCPLRVLATGGSQAIRIPRPRSPESRPSSHPKATIDRCIAVTHAADQKADINCNASKDKGGSFSRPPLSLK